MNLVRVTRRGLLAAGTGWAANAALMPSAVAAPVVKILVGFPPGQATDLVARLLADKLGAATGQHFIVENRPGQGGSLAMGALAKSPADGSTMMLTHMSAVATNPHMYKSVPYNALKDFQPVGLIGDLPFVLVCHPSLPCRDFQDLVQYAKAQPGKLMNASSGNGTVSHLAMEELKRRAGIDILHIPYKGSSAGLTDVVAGQVPLALETAAAVQSFVQSGKLRALGTGASQRLRSMPDVPTLAEQGVKDFSAVTWLMLLYPAGVAKPLLASTFSAVSQSMQLAEVDARMRQIGAMPRTSSSPDEATAYLRSEFAYWGEAVKRSGVQID